MGRKSGPCKEPEALVGHVRKAGFKAGPRSKCPRTKASAWRRPRAGSQDSLQEFCGDAYVCGSLTVSQALLQIVSSSFQKHTKHLCPFLPVGEDSRGTERLCGLPGVTQCKREHKVVPALLGQ